jgi:Uma2 family endonuclease
LLVVEVADTTVAYDRNTKLRLYAEAGIPEAWIVNVPAQRIEVYRDPVAGTYLARHETATGDVLSPSRLPAVALRVAELFD